MEHHGGFIPIKRCFCKAQCSEDEVNFIPGENINMRFASREMKSIKFTQVRFVVVLAIPVTVWGGPRSNWYRVIQDQKRNVCT